ncbi:hypothetical protein ACVWYG_000068 [Pedobacter sp. UYEF25]
MEARIDMSTKTAAMRSVEQKQHWGIGASNTVSERENVFLQAKLTVGSPNDPMEHEADAMADKVMRMPDILFAQRKCASCEEHENKVQRKFLASFIPSTTGQGGFVASDSVSNRINAAKGTGDFMDSHTQSFMQSRFGNDFSNVKIHTDNEAVQMNLDLNAKAFTVGNDIYFNEGKYSPNSDDGKRLLAHELTHTVQQGGSVGLAARRIQRTINTWGGEWDASPYVLKQDEANGTAYPAAVGVRGADITLKFTPNAKVDAELIGLTQTAQSTVAGTHPFIDGNPNREKRAITTGSEKGTMVDRADAYNNPIYAVKTQPSLSLSDASTSAGWGQLGWNNSSLTPPAKAATLIDSPRIAGSSKNSSQIFETTALATKGVQVGTYYGSVQWGWRTDAAGVHTLVPLSPISQGVPSKTFMTAAGIWNTAKDSTGADTVDLPIVDVKVTTSAISEAEEAPIQTMSRVVRSIPPGTRVQIIFGGATAASGERLAQIKIVDGMLTGTVMKITLSDLISLRNESA